MHPLLQHLSAFTWMDIIGSKEKSITFLQRMELLPVMHEYWAPECPKCSSTMTFSERKNYILGWRWICRKFHKKENPCLGSINPLDGTFFEGLKLPFMDVLALIFGYVMQISSDVMKDHLNCWRSCRKEREISNATIVNFYSRFDEVILHSLNQEIGKYKRYGKIDRNDLLKKYAKNLNAEPFFRNIVYNLLMDIKSQYPLKKTVSLSSLTNATKKSVLSNDTLISNKGNCNFTASNSTILNTSNATVSDMPDSTIINTIKPNASSARNSTVLNTSNSTVLNTSNSTVLNASNSVVLNTSKSAVLNTSNPTVLNTLSNSTIPYTSNSAVSDSLASTLSPVLNTSPVSVENTKAKRDRSQKHICISKDTPISACKNSNKLNCMSISTTEEAALNEIENSTEITNSVTLNNASLSTDISFDTTTKSISDNVNCYFFPSKIIPDNIPFQNSEYMDVIMDIDHDEIVTTTYE